MSDTAEELDSVAEMLRRAAADVRIAQSARDSAQHSHQLQQRIAVGLAGDLAAAKAEIASLRLALGLTP